MLEDMGFKSWQKQDTISSPKHPDQLQCPPSLQLTENQNFFSGSKVASADNLTTHIHLEPSLKISGAIPPLNLPPSKAHILPLSPTYVHISQQVTAFLVLQSNTFTHHLPVTCTLHDTFISSSLIQLH